MTYILSTAAMVAGGSSTIAAAAPETREQRRYKKTLQFGHLISELTPTKKILYAQVVREKANAKGGTSEGLLDDLADAIEKLGLEEMGIDYDDLRMAITTMDGDRFFKLADGRVIDAWGETVTQKSHASVWAAFQPNARRATMA